MGWGKKLRKAIKKVTKPIRKIVKPVEKLAQSAVGAVMPKQEAPKVEAPQQVTQAPAAVAVETATPEVVEHEDDAQTEAGRKKAARGGKKSLSVARSSGGGLNI